MTNILVKLWKTVGLNPGGSWKKKDVSWEVLNRYHSPRNEAQLVWEQLTSFRFSFGRGYGILHEYTSSNVGAPINSQQRIQA